MEEDTTRPEATQDEIVPQHIVENPSDGVATSSALQVHDEEATGTPADENSHVSAHEGRPSSTVAISKDSDSLENIPQDTTVLENVSEPVIEDVRPALNLSEESEVPISPANESVSLSTISHQSTTSTPEEQGGNSPPVPSRTSIASSSGHKRSLTMSKGNNVSVVLIISALETIAASREAKRSAPLRDSAQRALELIRSNLAYDHPRDTLEPLRLACETKNEKLMIASLDCISKLISFSFFAEDDIYISNGMPSPPTSPHPTGRNSIGRAPQASVPQPSIVDLVVHTITACHTETTPEAVSLQIVKALLALVLSPSVFVHHSSLLKTVRTVYNVFLLSADPVNQMVAQGGLSQMVHHIFTRCRPRGDLKQAEGTVSYSEDSQTLAASASRTSLTAVSQEEVLNSSNGSINSKRSMEEVKTSNGSSVSSPSPSDDIRKESLHGDNLSETVEPEKYVLIAPLHIVYFMK
jgi:brefeldin A-inhibited guanine nucleotide-exchange protein